MLDEQHIVNYIGDTLYLAEQESFHRDYLVYIRTHFRFSVSPPLLSPLSHRTKALIKKKKDKVYLQERERERDAWPIINVQLIPNPHLYLCATLRSHCFISSVRLKVEERVEVEKRDDEIATIVQLFNSRSSHPVFLSKTIPRHDASRRVASHRDASQNVGGRNGISSRRLDVATHRT